MLRFVSYVAIIIAFFHISDATSDRKVSYEIAVPSDASSSVSIILNLPPLAQRAWADVVLTEAADGVSEQRRRHSFIRFLR